MTESRQSLGLPLAGGELRYRRGAVAKSASLESPMKPDEQSSKSPKPKELPSSIQPNHLNPPGTLKIELERSSAISPEAIRACQDLHRRVTQS